MKSKKNIHNEDDKVTKAEEAAVAYGNPARKVIFLMGMHKKKEFQAIDNEADLIMVIRDGVPKEVMTNLMDITGINAQEMASITHTSDRTLRRYKPQSKLNQEQSERMIELAKLYNRGQEVFGSIESFKHWMETPLMAFGNSNPKTLLDTSLGIEWIQDELGRIEHGIFA